MSFQRKLESSSVIQNTVRNHEIKTFQQRYEKTVITNDSYLTTEFNITTNSPDVKQKPHGLPPRLVCLPADSRGGLRGDNGLGLTPEFIRVVGRQLKNPVIVLTIY